MISNELKSSIITEICSFIGSNSPPPFLVEQYWIELESGIWIVTKEQLTFIENHIPEPIEKKIKYAGIYLGKIRKNFGLSIEVLYHLQPFITRFGTVKGKTLQKYLYGKSVVIEAKYSDIKSTELNKLIIMTPDKQAVGISNFTVVDEYKIEEQIMLKLKLDAIADLGMFLRNERRMFE